MTRNKNYDVAIIGGGLAGLTLSCLLGQGGISVACIEQSAPVKNSDLRTTAISFGSRKILEQAGIWKDLEDDACPIEDIRILDGDSPLLLRFMSDDVEGRAFGWIVENTALREALVERTKKIKSVDHIVPAKVTGFDVHDDFVTVHLDTKKIMASLIVGADGRNSFVRDFMNVRTRSWDYDQRAVICCVSHEHAHDNKAVEHFWPGGPFAILPMSNDTKGRHRSSVVFTEHGPKRKSLMNLSEEGFETALQARFPDDYGQVTMIGKRACYPLSLVHAAEYIAPRMVLVADAAHGIHPVAGQGLNLGFRDVRTLAELALEAHNDGQDIGSAELLQEYQRIRRPDNMAMVAVTDGLVRLFSNNITPIRMIRKAGLRAVAKIPAAKQFFMRRAMGDF